jgi:hypothetical protein
MTLGRDQSRIGANARTDRPHNLLPNCLGRCSFCAPACRHACQLSETKNDGSTGSARERHGLFRCGAFQAARIRRPSIQYSRVVLPPGPRPEGSDDILHRAAPTHIAARRCGCRMAARGACAAADARDRVSPRQIVPLCFPGPLNPKAHFPRLPTGFGWPKRPAPDRSGD